MQTSIVRLALLLFLANTAFAQWQPVIPGVDYEHVVRGQMNAHIVRIDLARRSLRVIASNASDRGLTVSEFAKKHHAIVAINGDYFDEKLFPIGRALGACGVWWEGASVPRKEGFVTVGKRRADIQPNTMDVERWMSGGVAGWPMLVNECHVIQDLPGSDSFTRAPHPRTAAALSMDAKTLFLVVMEGRTEDAAGVTLPELATFLHDDLGACQAMNLDGGGSSAMWLRDAIVNRPSDGVERKVGNHLGLVLASDYSGCPSLERRAKH